MNTPASRLDAIAVLWSVGRTTDQIAAELHMTKGSVCRLAREARIAGDLRFPPRNAGRASAPARVVEISPRLKPTLAGIRPGQCKYPVFSGEARGDHHFCAEPQVPGAPYCKKHQDLCVSKVRAATVSSWAQRR